MIILNYGIIKPLNFPGKITCFFYGKIPGSRCDGAINGRRGLSVCFLWVRCLEIGDLPV